MKTYYCEPCRRPVSPVEQLDLETGWTTACPICGAPVTATPVQTDLFIDPQITLALTPRKDLP